MLETEEEERNDKRNANNVNIDTFSQSPVITNTQGDISNVTNQRQIYSDIMAETIKGFNGFKTQSTINDSTYYNSKEHNAESDPKSDQLVATNISDGKKRKVTDTDTINRNHQQKLLINRLIPETTPFIILPSPRLAEEVAASSGTLHAHQTIISEDIVTDVARSGVRIFKDPTVVNWKDTDRTIPRDGNTVRMLPILTTPVWIGSEASVSPTDTISQEIGSPSGSIGPQEVRDAQPLDTSINGIYVKHRDPATIGVRQSVANYPTNTSTKSTRAVG